MAMVGAFIAVSIMLGIGVQILGNSVQDCSNLPDFNVTADTAGDPQTGWAGQCETTNTQSQSAYSLLIIVIIVIAAVVILVVSHWAAQPVCVAPTVALKSGRFVQSCTELPRI